MNQPITADTPSPGAVPPTPSVLPRALWIGAGAVALTIAGIASALAWRGEPSEPTPEAGAAPAAEVATAPAAEVKPATKPPVARIGSHAPAVAAAPACANCGVVVSVTAVKQQGEGTGVGAVAGGVLGAAVGNQIGGGNGRTAMTVLGAIGGGVAGNAVEKNMRATTTYSVKVRLDDGSLRTLTLAQPPAVGARVQVDGANLRAV